MPALLAAVQKNNNKNNNKLYFYMTNECFVQKQFCRPVIFCSHVKQEKAICVRMRKSDDWY